MENLTFIATSPFKVGDEVRVVDIELDDKWIIKEFIMQNKHIMAHLECRHLSTVVPLDKLRFYHHSN